VADDLRYVQAKGTLYPPGSTHGFRPGSTVALPRGVAEALDQAGHLHSISGQPPPEAATPA
jgi:hypothetical protein